MLMMGCAMDLGARAGSLAMWQNDMINNGHAIWLEVFVAVAAIALLTQAIVVVVIAIAGYSAQKRAMIIVEEMRLKLMPLIEKSHGLVTDLSPKIQNITANVEHISFVVREKIVEFEPTVSAANETIKQANATVRDANAKTHAQIVRVNGMITSTLTATSAIGEKIHHGIRVPLREIEGIVSGAKAAIDSLMSKARGFGGGLRTEPLRPGGSSSIGGPPGGGYDSGGGYSTGFGARPASSVVRPPHSAGIEVIPETDPIEVPLHRSGPAAN